MPDLNRDWLWRVAKLLVLALAVATAALLVWQLASVLLLLFAAILVAVLLRSVAGLVERFTPIGSDGRSASPACSSAVCSPRSSR